MASASHGRPAFRASRRAALDRRRRSGGPQAEGEDRADGDGPPGVVEERVGDGARRRRSGSPSRRARSAPGSSSAHMPKPSQRDPVDRRARSARGGRGRRRRRGRCRAASGARRPAARRGRAARARASTGRRRWWTSHSGPKTRSELSSWPTAPSGWRQAPRPASWRDQRSIRSRSSRSRPSVGEARRSRRRWPAGRRRTARTGRRSGRP